jgi:hypothetical protein
MKYRRIKRSKASHPGLFTISKIGLLLFSFLILAALAGCSTLEVRIEKTPTPDKSAISTLVALMVEATRESELATQVALEPTAEPGAGTITGRICYPSEHIPAMLAYFKEIDSGRLDKFQIMANQATYQVNLPPGQYVAYAWATSYQVGGMYSKAVPCGLTVSCTDRSPQTFTVQSGQTTSGIDLCDWVIPVDQLPIPPGSELPGP